MGIPNGYNSIPGFMYLEQIAGMFNMGGNMFFVDSGTGSDTADGLTWGTALATIEAAKELCTANNGDVIFAAPGHVEAITAAGGLDLDVAGITVIFLGNGSNRATIQFGTVVGADMDIDAANITLVNPRFVAALDALTGPIDVNAANFMIKNGEYYDAAAMATTDCIVTAAGATGLKIHGWKYFESTTGTQKQSNIQLNGVDDAELVDIDVRGDFATGNIENVTDEVLNIRLKNLTLDNLNASPTPGMVIDANATGVAENVKIRVASGTTYVSNVGKINWGADCEGFSTDGYSGEPIGTAVGTGVEGKIDALTAAIGTPAADVSADIAAIKLQTDELGSAVGASLAADIAAIKAQTDELGAAVGADLSADIAAIKTEVDKTDIKTTSIADATTIPNNAQEAAGLLATATGGAVLIEEIIWQRGADNLVGPTNYGFSTDNTNGLTGAAAPNGVAVLAKFNANLTGILSIDGTTKQIPFVLESGKKLYIHGDDAATSAGVATDFYIKYRRLTAAASLT